MGSMHYSDQYLATPKEYHDWINEVLPELFSNLDEIRNQNTKNIFIPKYCCMTSALFQDVFNILTANKYGIFDNVIDAETDEKFERFKDLILAIYSWRSFKMTFDYKASFRKEIDSIVKDSMNMDMPINETSFNLLLAMPYPSYFLKMDLEEVPGSDGFIVWMDYYEENGFSNNVFNLTFIESSLPVDGEICHNTFSFILRTDKSINECFSITETVHKYKMKNEKCKNWKSIVEKALHYIIYINASFKLKSEISKLKRGNYKPSKNDKKKIPGEPTDMIVYDNYDGHRFYEMLPDLAMNMDEFESAQKNPKKSNSLISTTGLVDAGNDSNKSKKRNYPNNRKPTTPHSVRSYTRKQRYKAGTNPDGTAIWAYKMVEIQAHYTGGANPDTIRNKYQNVNEPKFGKQKGQKLSNKKDLISQ